MKKNLFVFLLAVCGIVFVAESRAQAQTKFDIVTYTAPAGWAVEKDENSLRFTKDAGSNYCVISLTRAVDGVGDSTKNFELLWQGMATEGLNAGTPQRGKGGAKNGWQAEFGVAAFEKEGLKGAALLTTFTGNGKVVAILAITNSDAFQADIETFVDNVKLPPIAAQKTPAASPVAANTGDAAKLIGRWQRSGSGYPAYADPASWGTAGYTTSRYEFKPDGTYIYTERSFRMVMQNIIVVKENGSYSTSGNTLTVKPAKSTITSYKKAGGVDALGAVVSTQNRKLETLSYKFTFHYFSGIQEWNLVLQADTPTQRDGPFSNNTTFNNAWYFDQKYTDTDLTAPQK
jgi:hypothetical protein